MVLHPAAKEAAFRRHRTRSVCFQHLCHRSAGAVKWAFFAAAALHTDVWSVALLAASLSLLGVLIATWTPESRQGCERAYYNNIHINWRRVLACAAPARSLQRRPLSFSSFCRLHYPLELLISIAQPLCACSLFHHIYPTTAGASALRAVACVAAGNGVLALACLAKTSPLTFRWALCSVLWARPGSTRQEQRLCSAAAKRHPACPLPPAVGSCRCWSSWAAPC
jgi:hypothetical protein